MLQVFIDTNVWFSAFYGSYHCEAIIRAHIDGSLQAVISEQVLDELVRNIQEKVPTATRNLKKLLQAYPPFVLPNPQKIPGFVTEYVDSKDQSIFSAAMLTYIDIFVTGNIKHFDVEKLEQQSSMRILTPVQLVNHLKRSEHVDVSS